MKSRHGKSVAFHTLGCKVNQYDTQAMQEKFVQNGYNITEFGDIADVYVINTCTVTNLGDRKSRQMIRRANRLNPNAVIAVVGCYAQTAAKEILEIPGVDLVLGTSDRNDIVQYVEKALDMDKPIDVVRDIMQVEEFEEMHITTFEDKTRAVLKIQEGCDRFCSYCIIPYARGPVRSRKPMDVTRQVKDLIEAGFKEFVLTGIHVASYGKDLGGMDLLTLIKEIHGLEGIKRIRLGSIEPTLLTEDFVREVKNMTRVCSHYHLSLQSGNDSTLRRMNRKYTTAQYREIVNRLRRYIPDVAITTDIMVGFPGETQEEFDSTVEFVKEINFSRIHVFKYSPRKGTPAARYKDQITEDIKESRSRRLIGLGREMEKNYLRSFLGREEWVLFEETSKNKEGWYEGYTQHYIRVAVPGHEGLIGSMVLVNLVDLKDNIMLGKLTDKANIG
ncbi:MAG: tRNA (N(6)-L-threonylcarbamoyladenosine(37)-C(2))-methylthiotransferase MtaB [Caldicoprobacterales bacterium]|jgi:threonylcarbamoyladenosine tRNA methylthiotransferase MtaB